MIKFLELPLKLLLTMELLKNVSFITACQLCIQPVP